MAKVVGSINTDASVVIITFLDWLIKYQITLAAMWFCAGIVSSFLFGNRSISVTEIVSSDEGFDRLSY